MILGGCRSLDDDIGNAVVNSSKVFIPGEVEFKTGDTISIFCNQSKLLKHVNKFVKIIVLGL